jgi:thymidine kinase
MVGATWGIVVAKLNLRYGAMNCGKSDTLIKTAYNYTENGLDIVTVMPELAMRKPGFTTSRAGLEWPIDIATTSETELYESYHRHIGNRAIACVLVDEVNFMTPEQVDDLERIAKVDNTSVVAFGIRGNIQRALFDGSRRMFELADTVEKMITMCPCGNQAEFNGRYVDGTFHVGEPIVWIDNGGRVKYQSLCASCYLEAMEQPGAITV